MTKKKILLGTPIRQKVDILKEFLLSITELNTEGLELDFLFIDDNIEKESSNILEDFRNKNSNTIILNSEYEKNISDYNYLESTHHWNIEATNKVGQLKNKIINIAKEKNYDYLFFVDSDLILHPNTIKHLVSRNVDIISEVFWTIWEPDRPILPQVWMSDNYNFVSSYSINRMNKEEINFESIKFVEKMKIPNFYKVGGLGACTLISNNAIKKGISFDLISNISFVGEDRHFCIRANVLGLDLYADTCFPPLHVYRTFDLIKIPFYKQKFKEIDLNKFDYIKTLIDQVFSHHFKEENKLKIIELINNKRSNFAELILEGLLEVYKDDHTYIFLNSVILLAKGKYKNSIETVSKLLNSKEISKSDVYFLISKNFKLLEDQDLSDHYMDKSNRAGSLELINLINPS